MRICKAEIRSVDGYSSVGSLEYCQSSSFSYILCYDHFFIIFSIKENSDNQLVRYPQAFDSKML